MMKDNRGFTLIEVIATLVIIGIVAVFAGFGIMEGMTAYFTGKENIAAMQKAQLTLARFKSEIATMDRILSSGGDSLRFTSYRDDPPQKTYEVSKSGQAINLSVDGSSHTLMDSAGAGSLFTYYNSNGSAGWTTGNGFQNLKYVEITVGVKKKDLSGSSAQTIQFTTVAVPRNNGASNAPLPK